MIDRLNIKISSFWRWFESAQQMLECSSEGEAIRSELYSQIQSISQDLHFEISVNTSQKELIITAQGKKNAFEMADRIVAQAPIIEHWTFRALKPAEGFDFEMNIDGRTYDPAKMVCRPIEIRSSPPLLGLVVGVENFKSQPEKDWENVILLMLDAGLGERQNVEYIARIKVVEKSELRNEDTISLKMLPNFLSWCLKD